MSALVFRAGGVTSKRLADVSGGRALDDRALVSRMLLHPPYVRGDTLYAASRQCMYHARFQ